MLELTPDFIQLKLLAASCEESSILYYNFFCARLPRSKLRGMRSQDSKLKCLGENRISFVMCSSDRLPFIPNPFSLFQEVTHLWAFRLIWVLLYIYRS